MPYKNPKSARRYRERHREEKAAYDFKYRRENKERIAAKRYEYDVRHKERKAEYDCQYREKNREKISAGKQKYDALRMAKDSNYKLAKGLRSRLGVALRGNIKSGSAVRDLGCPISAFRVWLEDQFQPGMTWENYGAWHIDHVIPLSAFDLTNRAQLTKACHYTNLQPLWAEENYRKGRTHNDD